MEMRLRLKIDGKSDYYCLKAFAQQLADTAALLRSHLDDNIEVSAGNLVDLNGVVVGDWLIDNTP